MCKLWCTEVYNRCVHKFDHYCVWIGNCIGGLNHRYFLALLLSLSAMSVHGVWGICKIFRAVISVHNINTASGTYYLIKVTLHIVEYTAAAAFSVCLTGFCSENQSALDWVLK